MFKYKRASGAVSKSYEYKVMREVIKEEVEAIVNRRQSSCFWLEKTDPWPDLSVLKSNRSKESWRRVGNSRRSDLDLGQCEQEPLLIATTQHA